MKLKLKNNILYLDISLQESTYKHTIELDIEESNKDFKRYIAVNEGPFVEVEGNRFDLPKITQDENTLVFRLKLVNRKTRKTEVYTSDPIKQQYLRLLGEEPKDLYPNTYSAAMRRIHELEKKVKLLSQAVVELNKKGEWL